MTKSIKGISKRVVYFDYLRIAAIIAVVVLHVASSNWYVTDVNSLQWNSFNIYDSLMRWGVPIFVMISGALFLDREQSLSKLYKKNILRILIILIIWTIINSVWQLFTTDSINSFRDFVTNLFTGPYYLWFLYMLIGLYMVTPFLKRIVENKKTMRYFLLLAFLFTFLIPELIQIVALKSELAAGLINDKLDMMRLFMVLGYTGYFVLGYYLSKTTVKGKAEVAIYILGILGAIFTIVSTALLSNYKGVADALFYNNLTVNVLSMSVAVFVLFKNHIHKACSRECGNRFWQLISRCSLGVYLVHLIVLESLDLCFGLNSLSLNPIVSVPLVAGAVLVISYTISIAVYKIPKIGKWIM